MLFLLLTDVGANWLFSLDDPLQMGPQMSMSTKRVRIKGKGFVVAHEAGGKIEQSVTLNSVESKKLIEPEQIITENRQLRQEPGGRRKMLYKEVTVS